MLSAIFLAFASCVSASFKSLPPLPTVLFQNKGPAGQWDEPPTAACSHSDSKMVGSGREV